MLTYLRAIESDSLLIRGETGMLANADESPEFVARKEAFGHEGRLRDLVLPGSHHLHVRFSEFFALKQCLCVVTIFRAADRGSGIRSESCASWLFALPAFSAVVLRAAASSWSQRFCGTRIAWTAKCSRQYCTVNERMGI